MNQKLILLFSIVFLVFLSISAYGQPDNNNKQFPTQHVITHLRELQQEIGELETINQKLLDLLTILKLNTDRNGKIITTRMKQLGDVEETLMELKQENQFIKENIVITFFPDGKRARSCKEYRYPPAPYKYSGAGSGLYQIEPTQGQLMTVYCDMTTDGGGWTLISGIKKGYEGIHFHTFEDSSAVATSNTTPFHIKTRELLVNATQIRTACDSSTLEIDTFYQSEWPFSGACSITSELRNAISNPTLNNGDLPTKCEILSGLQSVPTSMEPRKVKMVLILVLIGVLVAKIIEMELCS